MTLVLDSSTTDSVQAASCSTNHAVGVGVNTVLVALIGLANNPGDGGAPRSMTGITAGGVAMTKMAEVPCSNGVVAVALYTLAKPPTGTIAIVSSWSGSCHMKILIRSYFGGDVGEIVRSGSLSTLDADTSAPSLSVSSKTGDQVVDFLTVIGGGVTITVGAGQTQLLNSADSDNRGRFGASHEAGTEGNVTMSWSLSLSSGLAYVGASIKAASRKGQAVISPSLLF